MKTDKETTEMAKAAFRYSGAYAALFILRMAKRSEKKLSAENKQSPWVEFIRKVKNNGILKFPSQIKGFKNLYKKLLQQK